MLKLRKIFQRVGDQVVELSLQDWMNESGLEVTFNQAVFSTSEEVQSGSILELPAGMYNPSTDAIIINQEGFMLIPNYQYIERSATQIELLIDIEADTNIHVLIFKLHKNITE